MSTKTIAVEHSVYERLALAKEPSESFTKVIDRLLNQSKARTCDAAVQQAARVWGQSPEDAAQRAAEADRMEHFIQQARERTEWEVEELR